MNLSDSWLCLWPGLPRLWLRGDWQALGAAVLFAGALNLTLIHSFLWPELLPLPSPLWLWPILVLVWSIATWRGWQSVPDLLQVPVGAQPEAGGTRLFGRGPSGLPPWALGRDRNFAPTTIGSVPGRYTSWTDASDSVSAFRVDGAGPSGGQGAQKVRCGPMVGVRTGARASGDRTAGTGVSR